MKVTFLLPVKMNTDLKKFKIGIVIYDTYGAL